MSKRRPKRTIDHQPTEAERKAFNAHKFDLLDKAVLDVDLTPFQFSLLYYIISKYLWKPGDLAYPGYDVLAAEFGASSRAIEYAMEKFEVRGYLTCVMRGHRGRGENRASEYELGPGPQAYRRRIYKSKKSITSENHSRMAVHLCAENQSRMAIQSESNGHSQQSRMAVRPNSMEGAPLKEHTPQKGVCGDFVPKERVPTTSEVDSHHDDRQATTTAAGLTITDDEAEAMEFFAELAGKNIPSSDRPANGGNGPNPTSPLDDAVTAYIAVFANQRKQVSKPHVIRQELEKVLEKFYLVMAAVRYHQMAVWPVKKDQHVPTPENFLINETWASTPRYILDDAERNHRQAESTRREIQEPGDSKPLNWDEVSSQFPQNNDDECDDGSDGMYG